MDAGTIAAARANFEMLVTDLVKVKFPDATSVEGPGGRDWGIDAFVGQLSGGQVSIWQSKFVRNWIDKTPQQQVRDSFKSARDKALAEGYTISTWTLVIPCLLPPDQMKWFKGWAKGKFTSDRITVTLWDGVELRHQLLNREAADVGRNYFPHLFPTSSPTRAVVAALPNARVYDGALFIRQLNAAGRVETDSASAHFYATDALIRDLTDKGDTRGVDAMTELQLEVWELWESRYNSQHSLAGSDGIIPDLIDAVLTSAGQCADPPGVNLALAHRKGTIHRLVDQSKAGWVTHWHDIADAYLSPADNEPADSTSVATSGAPSLPTEHTAPTSVAGP